MSFIAEPEASWLIPVAGEAVGAVAGSVATGIVTGAVVGAGVALVTGGDVLDGALKGAAVGGIGGAIYSGFGIMTGSNPATDQLAAFGVDGYSKGGGAPSKKFTASDKFPTGQSTENGTTRGGGLTPEVQAKKDQLFSDNTAKIIGGILEGGAEGWLTKQAAEDEVEGAKELAQWNLQQENLKMAANVPSEFKAQTANIQIPNWWKNYLNTQQQQPGILTQEVV